MARTALLLALVATSANAITDNFVDGQCATDDGADHFPYKSDDVSIHQCDCSVMSEEDCLAPMVWTSGCASCAGGTDDPDQPPDESDSATRAVLAAAAVVAALVF